MTLEEFAAIKTLSSTVGLAMFAFVFIAFTLWVFRPGSKRFYQDQARKILED